MRRWLLSAELLPFSITWPSKTAKLAVNSGGFRVSQILSVFCIHSLLSERKGDFRCLMMIFAQYLAFMLII